MVDVKVVSRLILSSKIYGTATESQKKLFEERTKKLIDQYNLKYQNISKDNFCELCEEVISMMKDISD